MVPAGTEGSRDCFPVVAEHGGCYRRVAEMSGARLDFDVVAVDYRGHGRSPGRGFVKCHQDLVGDLSGVLAWTERQLPSAPRFVLAHSNGGQAAFASC